MGEKEIMEVRTALRDSLIELKPYVEKMAQELILS
jgi:hypothetical protein